MEGEQKDERFISILKELETLKEDFVVREIERYRKATGQARFRFRFASVLIIVLSASLPLLSTLREGIWISIVLPIVALTITGLSGLSAFFHWESNWRGFSQTCFALEYHLKAWELKIIEAKYEADPQKAIDIAMQATKQLLDEAHAVTNEESEEFFKRTQLPKAAM